MRAPLLPTLLVVDDEPDARFLIVHALRKAGIGHPIATAVDGAAAIDYLRGSCPAGGGARGRKPALVLLDVHMPRMNGFEVLRWIRRKRTFDRAKVILLTSSDDPRDLARARALGADAYLLKFPSPLVLGAVVRQALGEPAAGAAPCGPGSLLGARGG
jgi:CheY-like chemotaxis protein